MTDRMIGRTWAGPEAAAFYIANGLRVVPLHPTTKEAARRGFGKQNPEFCTRAEDFRPGELVAILLGPCPLGTFAGGRLLCGLDLDAPFDGTSLFRFLGPLPYTLSSKQGRHLYFWITKEQHEKGELTQGNDVFRTKAAGQGALDLRPAAGGYFLERGDWDDGGFDRCAIRDLPDAAHAALLAARNRGRGRPLAPCALPVDAYQGDEASPMNALSEDTLNDLARALAGLWPKPGQGGGHDLALALGGILADAYGSLDDVCDFAARVFHYAQAPSAVAEVATSVQRRRSGATQGVFGWPTLKRMLVAASGDEVAVSKALDRLRLTVPGLNRTKDRTQARTAWRVEQIRAFDAAGRPGAREIGLAAATAEWLAAARYAEKQNAPGQPNPGASNHQPTEGKS